MTTQVNLDIRTKSSLNSAGTSGHLLFCQAPVWSFINTMSHLFYTCLRLKLSPPPPGVFNYSLANHCMDRLILLTLSLCVCCIFCTDSIFQVLSIK